MPLSVLLWIICLLPAAMLAWYLFSVLTDLDGDIAIQGLVLISFALILAAPNLIWYKAVRDVMYTEAAPVTLTVEK